MLFNTNIVAGPVLIVLIIIQSSIMTNGEITLSIKTTPHFPHPIDKSFDMVITSSINNKTIDDSYTDLLLMRITDAFGMTHEMSIFDYGMKDKIDREFIGRFVKIQTWKISLDRKSINLSIWFTKLSNNKTLEIYKINVSSKKIRHHILDNLKSGIMIYQSKINILIPPRLKISVNGIDGSRNVFTIGEVVIVTCQVVEAIPKQIPIFTNLRNFTVKASSFNVERNEREVLILLSISDHLKTLICAVGKERISINFKIFHHPTAVTVNPGVISVVRKDAILECSHKDGYPTPTVQWSFIEGPPDAKKYFNISSDGKQLFLKKNSISDNLWKFNCSVRSSYLNSTQISNQTISFIVQDKERIVDRTIDPNDLPITRNQAGDFVSKYYHLFRNLDKRIKYLENDKVNQSKKTNEMMTAHINQNNKLINETNNNLNNRFSELLKQISETKRNMEKQIQLLNDKMDNKSRTIQIDDGFIWKIRKFKEVLLRARQRLVMDIFSESFYSHKNGYKMCLSSHPAGPYGNDSYFGIYLHIMKGEFDDLLSWPMKSEIKIALINQNTGQPYFIKTNKYDTTEDKFRYVFNRPISSMNNGFGNDKYFIPDEMMKIPELYKNNEIHLKCTVIP